jgi:iron complex transport system substrate-binding protein
MKWRPRDRHSRWTLGPQLPRVLRGRFFVVASLFTACLATVGIERTATATERARTLIENCGVSTNYTQPPSRAVTLNQAATEVMLALGLQDRVVGTAYLDDQVLQEFAAAYQRIPILAAKYPSREVLLATRPDFLYAAYPGAFSAAGIGSRADWKSRRVDTYLAPAACTDKSRPPGVSLELTFAELRDVARIFGVTSRAEKLIDAYRTELQVVRDQIGPISKPPAVFWYDEEDPPHVGACCGAPNDILRLVGAKNIFADTPGSWTPVSWETVIARNPDVIVLANASWSTAATKRQLLLSKKALAGVEAIKRGRIVEIDFAYTTPGIRNVAAVRKLAEALYPERFR